MATEQRRRTEDGRRPGPLQVVFSVAAAFFGVQSSRVRRRDFTRGRPGPFLGVALLMTAVVVLAFVAAVGRTHRWQAFARRHGAGRGRIRDRRDYTRSGGHSVDGFRSRIILALRGCSSAG